MQHYTNTLFDTFGNAISGASVNVYAAGTTTPSTIYSDNIGTTTPNPLTTGADGSYDFYAANGRYDLLFTHPGHTFSTPDNAGISLFDSAAASMTFPAAQVSSADPNTLDDYEEGTWTPSVGGTATYTAQFGTYTKVGNRVHITCTLIINVLGTGSVNTISGLPFAGATSPTLDQALSPGFDADLAVSPVSLNPVVVSSTSTVTYYGRTAGATGVSSMNLLGNAAHVSFSGTYRTT